jgi:hypothetical protein
MQLPCQVHFVTKATRKRHRVAARTRALLLASQQLLPAETTTFGGAASAPPLDGAGQARQHSATACSLRDCWLSSRWAPSSRAPARARRPPHGPKMERRRLRRGQPPSTPPSRPTPPAPTGRRIPRSRGPRGRGVQRRKRRVYRFPTTATRSCAGANARPATTRVPDGTPSKGGRRPRMPTAATTTATACGAAAATAAWDGITTSGSASASRTASCTRPTAAASRGSAAGSRSFAARAPRQDDRRGRRLQERWPRSRR